mmetsp:Transcript_11192/g.28200  ORF Transcript_11192/g.28200 Transcript_11192/m.28200 type:complete len:221 (-) Transcript_11192:244-906(-)
MGCRDAAGMRQRLAPPAVSRLEALIAAHPRVPELPLQLGPQRAQVGAAHLHLRAGAGGSPAADAHHVVRADGGRGVAVAQQAHRARLAVHVEVFPAQQNHDQRQPRRLRRRHGVAHQRLVAAQRPGGELHHVVQRHQRVGAGHVVAWHLQVRLGAVAIREAVVRGRERAAPRQPAAPQQRVAQRGVERLTRAAAATAGRCQPTQEQPGGSRQQRSQLLLG